MYPKVYDVYGEDFNAIKNAVKATGAKFDGGTRRWTVNKAGLDSLKASFEVKASDFGWNDAAGNIIFRAERDQVIYTSSRGGMNPRSREEMLEALKRLQTAYSKSDEEFAKIADELGINNI
jgi:hypothetical protein